MSLACWETWHTGYVTITLTIILYEDIGINEKILMLEKCVGKITEDRNLGNRGGREKKTEPWVKTPNLKYKKDQFHEEKSQ